MNRFQSDQWLLGPTPSITSSFRLSLKKGHSNEINQGKISSVECGLGWKFAFIATNADKELGDRASGNVLIPLQKTEFELFFDLHIWDNADFKSLMITTTFENLSPLSPEDSHTKNISLPNLRKDYTLGRFNSEENYTGYATVTFRVDLPMGFKLSLPMGFLSSKLQRVLGDSLMGLDIVDTKFILFTCRTREHQPSKPQALFGNSHLLHGFSSYLDTLLDGNGYKESTEVDLGSDLFDDIPTDGFDYMSDSDLDSDHEADISSVLPSGQISPQAPSFPPTSPWAPPTLAPTPPVFSLAPTSSFTTDENTNILPHEEPSTNNTLNSGDNVISHASPHTGKFGRRIIINDTAFRTWKSLLFYIYTGKLEFISMGRIGRFWGFRTASSGIPTCSPKSMFRLADKIDLPELQQLALDAIRRALTRENILDELFSKFTSMYPKVQEIEIEFLAANLTPDLLIRLKHKLALVVAGELPHSFGVLSDLIEKMCNGGVQMLNKSRSPTSMKSKGRRV